MPGLEWKRLGWMRAASQRGKGEATVACSAWFAGNRVLKTKRRKVCSMTGSDLCIAAVSNHDVRGRDCLSHTGGPPSIDGPETMGHLSWLKPRDKRFKLVRFKLGKNFGNNRGKKCVFCLS